MITPFNRRELIITDSMERQGAIRALLSQNGIHYRLRTRSLTCPGVRVRTGSAGIDLEHMYMYTFYVHKDDYEKARHVIGV